MLHRYLIVYASFTLLLLTSVFSLNWLTDPLWYGRGNRLSPKNFPFDERSSKTNLFLRSRPEDYNCVIFGSSRATLLRQSQFTQHQCFNYAFGGSSIDEYLAYAHLVNSHNPSIEKVYLGIDAFNFKPSVSQDSFQVAKPGHILKSYLSFDIFAFSIGSLLNPALKPRYYNSQRNFEIAIVENWPAYQPRFEVIDVDHQCDRSKINRYRELAAIFPNATVVGFAAPVSAWHLVNQIDRNGNLLDCYLQANHELAQEFEAVYDFTLPSEITKDPRNSYDSNHYYLPVMDQVSQIIQQGIPSESPRPASSFGLHVSDYSKAEYQSLYRREIQAFLEAQQETPHPDQHTDQDTNHDRGR